MLEQSGFGSAGIQALLPAELLPEVRLDVHFDLRWLSMYLQRESLWCDQSGLIKSVDGPAQPVVREESAIVPTRGNDGGFSEKFSEAHKGYGNPALWVMNTPKSSVPVPCSDPHRVIDTGEH